MMDNSYDKIVVEIYNGTYSKCESGCSTCGTAGCGATTVEEEFEGLRQELKKTFGDSVEVKYFDTDVTGMDEKGYCRQIIEAGYKFPVTVINGQPRIAGAINVPLIREYLDRIAFELFNVLNGSSKTK